MWPPFFVWITDPLPAKAVLPLVKGETLTAFCVVKSI